MAVDPVTSEYVRRCQTDERLRSVLASSQLPPLFERAWGGRLLSRPFFAEGRTMDALGSDLKRLFDIVVSLPERLFDGDIVKYCSAIGLDERRAALISCSPVDGPSWSGRADLYRDGSGFKVLEFNLNTGFGGGADLGELCRALLATEPFAEFARDFGLEYADMMAVKAELFREAAAPVFPGREPAVALIEGDGALAGYWNGFRSYQGSLPSYGLRLSLGELGQLRQENGRVRLDDEPIDLVLRYFHLDQIIDDPGGLAAYEMIRRAHVHGTTALYPTLRSHLFSNKAALALLSDQRYEESFAGPEQELIDRMLPWTRLLREGRTWYDGERVDLMRLAIEQRPDLILKPGAGLSGRGVVAGWETGERAWERLLRRSVGGPFVVQRRVDPVLEPVVEPGSGRLEHVVPVWGVFFAEPGYTGAHVRTAPADGGAVINFASNPRSSITGLFTYDRG